MPELFTKSLQENLISLLGHSDQYGKIILNLVETDLFEGDYRVIAEEFVNYWREYNEAPKTHAADLFDDILRGNDRRAQVYKRILMSMMQLNDQGINAEYVVREASIFTRKQMLQEAIFRAAQTLQSGGAGQESITEVENIIADILRAKNHAFKSGSRLSDIDSLMRYVQHDSMEFATGIEMLDQAHVVPRRGEVFLMIGGKGRGKTWFLTNTGRVNLRRDKRILHVSLENSEEEQKLRYWQAMHAVPKHHMDEVEITRLEMREHKRNGWQVTGTYTEVDDVDFSFDSPHIQTELTTRLERMGTLDNNLRIVRFPNRSLTGNGLNAYLDSLEQVEGFIPDMLVLDYAKLMKIDTRNPRTSIGQNMEELRAIAVERNLALVTADQLNRPGYKAKQGHSTHIAEDWSEVHTADTVAIHAATDTEFNAGLARIWVEHCRTAKDKFGVLITQNYTVGQYCIDSARLPNNYYEEIMKDLEQVPGGDDGDDGDDE